MTAKFENQSSDAENSKAAPKSTARDNDLSSTSLGTLQSIANKSNSGQNVITGSGGDAVTSTRK